MTTAKEYLESMTYDQREQFCRKIECWLGGHTDEVFRDVMNQMDTIVNDPHSLRLIDELYTRTQKVKKDIVHSIECCIRNPETFLQYGIHLHPLEHPDSYRDVLYDMYIADRPLDQTAEPR